AEPRDRPRVGPWPRLRVGFAAKRPLPGPLQENLGEPGFRVNPRAVAQLPQSKDCEQGDGAQQKLRARQILPARRAAAARAAASNRVNSPTNRCTGASVAPWPRPNTAV